MIDRAPDFIFHFNYRRQWVEVYLWDVHPSTFERWDGGRWGYWHGIREQKRVGKFGELHFVASRVEQAADHELMHLWIDLVIYTRGNTISPDNEERLVEVKDELNAAFWRGYGKLT